MESQNPSEVFCEGRNEEEALQAACDRLNTTPNQVEYEVVESGAAGGVLGFLKGRTVRIRVWRKSESQRKLTELVKGFCDAFDVGLTCEIAKVDDGYEIAFETDGSDGLLIGRGGETLAALQHLLSRMAAHMDETLRVHVDVAGYRRRRQEKLRRNARELADRCLDSGREMMTEPLPADERRVVHLALAEDPRVETRAIGEGLTKRVAVLPSSGKAAAARAETPAAGPRSGERGPGGRERRGASSHRGEGRRGHERDASRGDGPGRSRRGGSSGRSGARTPADRLRSATRAIEERQRPELPDRPEGAELSDTADRAERPERAQRPRHAERGERSAHSLRGERSRRHAPAREPAPAESDAAERREPSLPAAEPAAATPPGGDEREGSYFRIPDRIGLVTPAPEKKEPEGETESAEPKPLTFGRRPRADRRRR